MELDEIDADTLEGRIEAVNAHVRWIGQPSGFQHRAERQFRSLYFSPGGIGIDDRLRVDVQDRPRLRDDEAAGIQDIQLGVYP